MDNYFADYDTYSSEDIDRILPDGIELSGGRKIRMTAVLCFTVRRAL